jgi:hypothetical protein
MHSDSKAADRLELPIGFTPVTYMGRATQALLYKSLGSEISQHLPIPEEVAYLPVGPILMRQLFLTDTVQRAHQVSAMTIKQIIKQTGLPGVTLESRMMKGRDVLFVLATNIVVMATLRCRNRILKLLRDLECPFDDIPKPNSNHEPGSISFCRISVPPSAQDALVQNLLAIRQHADPQSTSSQP